jgi:hypothetical protein
MKNLQDTPLYPIQFPRPHPSSDYYNANCMLCGKNIYDGMGRDVISKGFLR